MNTISAGLSNNFKTGVLLVNLGTPDSASTRDVRKYLIQFLTDPRVIDIPALQRNLLVRGIIGPFRSPKSARSYKEIWTEEGSPLLAISMKLRREVARVLGDGYQVELAMRYQNPSIQLALESFEGKAIKKLRIVPLFPQYASASTGSVHEEVMRIVSKWQVIPDLEFVNSYPVDRGMIAAFGSLGRMHRISEFDHVLLSFHGLPERQLIKADSHGHCLQSADCCTEWTERNNYCYSAQCYATAKALAEELGLNPQNHSVCFQSRLGKTPWRQPFTIDLIRQLASAGKKRVLVFCPAFVSDCLETIYEIGVEYAEDFRKHGGEELVLVDGLNTHPLWVEALAGICRS
jgi:protoporphyrin/coproporphyrin ferrochelatase